jgi:UDP-glucose 4-epimerase
LLRYFHHLGAYERDLIGEDPNGISDDLVSFVARIGVRRLAQLNVFGNHYKTIDGTEVRDYLDVVDLTKRIYGQGIII